MQLYLYIFTHKYTVHIHLHVLTITKYQYINEVTTLSLMCVCFLHSACEENMLDVCIILGPTRAWHQFATNGC